MTRRSRKRSQPRRTTWPPAALSRPLWSLSRLLLAPPRGSRNGASPRTAAPAPTAAPPCPPCGARTTANVSISHLTSPHWAASSPKASALLCSRHAHCITAQDLQTVLISQEYCTPTASADQHTLSSESVDPLLRGAVGFAVKSGPTRCNACGIYVTSYGMERPVDEYGNLDKAAAKRVVSHRSPPLPALQCAQSSTTCSLPHKWLLSDPRCRFLRHSGYGCETMRIWY